jgi:pyridoxine kinase
MPRVLSVQSHVVHGYVGNKSAVFPLQLLGFDVDPINSVQFSNHTGYETIKGDVLGGEQLNSLVDGLQANGLHGKYSHMLTGYIGSTTFLRAILRTLKILREAQPDLIYVCDPVMGDLGPGLYIPEELVAIYREEVLPVATMITPNMFEAEKLTGMSIKSDADAVRACKAIHDRGPSIVVLTSLEYEGDGEGEKITCIASQMQEGEQKLHRLLIPRVPAPHGGYTGTGDLSAALLLAWTHHHPNELQLALEKTVSTLLHS